MSESRGARSRARKRPPNNRRPRATAPARPDAQRHSALERALDESAALAVPFRPFAELGLPARVVARLAEAGIDSPTEVQNRTIPDALAGRDVLGRAQTGSGKTLAFGLPLVTKLAAQGRPATPRHPRALVLAPTRELAQQVADSIGTVARSLNLSVVAIYGGAAMGAQIKALERGVDIVVATPGRLEDHMARGTCSLSRVDTFIIDEADHMADLGFLPAVTRIFEAIPATAQRLLFSATLDRGIERLATTHLTDPAIHAAAVGIPAAETMEHRAFTMEREHKVEVAAQVAARHGRTLFFVRTKHGADRLARQLQQRGIESAAIHGNRNQSQRNRALADFASGRRPVLVATDVAARGIHVDGVDLVVHYDPPADHKDYLHRSGRTARAGRDGLVLSLLLDGEAGKHRRMHRDTSSDHSAIGVHPGHPEVMDIASGGTPLENVPEAPHDAPPKQHGQGRRRGGRNGRPDGGNRQGSNRGGQGSKRRGGAQRSRTQGRSR